MKIKDKYLNDAGALLNIATAYAENKDHDNAVKYFDKAISLCENEARFYFTYGSYLLHYCKDNPGESYGISAHQKELLQKTESLLTKAVDILEKTEKNWFIVDAYINRSSARVMMQDLEGSLADVEQILKYDPDNVMARKNRGRIYSMQDKFDLAKDDFGYACEKESGQGGSAFDYAIALLNGSAADIARAKTILEKYYPNEALENTLEAAVLYVECYISEKAYDAANKMLEKLFEIHGQRSKLLITKANLCKARGEEAEFERLLKQAVTSKDLHDKTTATAQLAKYYRGKRLFDQAIPLYETLVSAEIYDEFMREYLGCLYHSKNQRGIRLRKCLDICEKFSMSGTEVAFILELQANIYQMLDRLDEAKGIYERLVALHPTILRYQLSLATTKIEMGGEFQSAGIQELEKNKEKVSEYEDVILVAQYCLRLGQLADAVKFAYKAYEMNSNSEKVQLLYTHAFLSAEQGADKLLLDSDVVKGGYFVTFKKNNNQQECLMIEQAGYSALKNELSLESELGKCFANKKKGETFVVTASSGNSERFEIIEIKHKYVKAFQDIMDNFNSTFPKSSNLQKVEMNPDEIKKRVKQMGERHEKTVDLYLKKNLTLGALSNILGRDLLDVWGGLVATKDYKIYCATGNPKEQDGEISLIENSQNCVIDIISIMSLAYLDLLDLPVKIFQTCFVAKAAVDEIEWAILRQQSQQGRGYMTLSYKNGQYYRDDVSAESVESRVKYLDKIKSQLMKQYKTVGIEMLDEKMMKREDLLGRSPVYSSQVAKEKNAPMYCDDMLFRQLSFNEEKLEGFSTQSLLVVALKKGVISAKDYSDALIKLVLANYSYISISDAVLYRSVERANFVVMSSTELKELLKLIGSTETTLPSMLNVLAGFIKLIYMENLLPANKRDYLFLILSSVKHRKEPMRDITNALRDEVKRRLGLARHLLINIDRDMNDWLKHGKYLIT